MTAITYHPVSDVDFDDFTTAFNHAYSDYFVHIFMTSDSFQTLMDRDDLNREASVAAIQDDQIVGMGLLGIRDLAGWIGGLGVIPGYRRQGIGRQMMHHLLARARDHGLSHVKLEVIEANERAYALYHQLGFEDVRYLHYLERAPSSIPDVPQQFQIERQNPAVLLDYFAQFHGVENPWQRAHPSLMKLAPNMRGWAALDQGDVVGYVLGWTDPHQIRISDMAIRASHHQTGVAQALLTHLHRLYPDAHSLSINIAADDPAFTDYNALGYTTHLRQIEMRLAISDDAHR